MAANRDSSQRLSRQGRLPHRRRHPVPPRREGPRRRLPHRARPSTRVERGHIAFRTDDIDAFKKRLKEKGIPFSDYGAWAMKGWEQIFFYDPDGNIIEVHQVRE